MKRKICIILVIMLFVVALFSGCGELSSEEDMLTNLVIVSGEEKANDDETFIKTSMVKSYETFKKYARQKDETIQAIRYIEPVGRTLDVPLDRLIDTSKPIAHFDARYNYNPDDKPRYGKIYFTDHFYWGDTYVAVCVNYMAPDAYDNIHSSVFLEIETPITLNSGEAIDWGGWYVVPYAYSKDMFKGTDIYEITDSYAKGYVYVNFNENVSAIYDEGKLMRVFFMYENVSIVVYGEYDTGHITPKTNGINGIIKDLLNLETMNSVTKQFDEAMAAEYPSAN